MATPSIIGRRHYDLAQDIRRTLAPIRRAKDNHCHARPWSVYRQKITRCLGRARRLERFLTQPFFTHESFTGMSGEMVSLEMHWDGSLNGS